MLGFIHRRRYRRAVATAADDLVDAFGHLAPDEARRAALRAGNPVERAFCEAVAAHALLSLGDGEPLYPA